MLARQTTRPPEDAALGSIDRHLPGRLPALRRSRPRRAVTRDVLWAGVTGAVAVDMSEVPRRPRRDHPAATSASDLPRVYQWPPAFCLFAFVAVAFTHELDRGTHEVL
jgi:hypothetical protein